ncbi:alpha/beta hydrolase [Glycomyces sp. NPDC048151]|uniref:alpha/beta hydrolase n=1 Tax=Glycomyces sp. NPDC048151 TaxID=3364002 RepID=UPI003711ECCE
MSLPWGYLVGALVIAIPALPMPRMPFALGNVVFFASITVIELPFLAAAGFAASTALAVADGSLASPAAVVAAVFGAYFVSLTLWRGLRTQQVMQEAMGEVRIGPRPPLWRLMLRPFAFRPRSVEKTANIAYGPAGKRHRLDLYRHRSAPVNAPVLIHFHGGYYTTGHKSSQSRPLLHRLAEQGWITISANYRLRPSAGFEDHVTDAKRVIAWVREHGAAFGADPDRIILSGSSAGANMSALAALMPGNPRFQQGFEDVDTSVSGVVGLGGYWGPYFDGDPDSDPLAKAHPGAPPFLIVHGGNDTVVRPEGARRFAAGLRAVSDQPVVYAELPGGNHGFDLFHSPRFEAVVNAVEAFATRAVATAVER